MSIKHDDLYARAWECEDEKPIFNSNYNDVATPHSSGITIRTDLGTDKTDLSVEQPNATPINPSSTKFDLRHIPKPNCNDD